MSASQFVREAAIGRAIFMRTKRGKTDAGDELEAIVKRVRAEDS